jgi:hypothetical protein
MMVIMKLHIEYLLRVLDCSLPFPLWGETPHSTNLVKNISPTEKQMVIGILQLPIKPKNKRTFESNEKKSFSEKKNLTVFCKRNPHVYHICTLITGTPSNFFNFSKYGTSFHCGGNSNLRMSTAEKICKL